MTRKQISAKAAKLAATYIRLTDGELDEMMANKPNTLVKVLRTLAAACLSPDEVKGAKPRKRKQPMPTELG